MKTTTLTLLSYGLAVTLAVAPAAAFAKDGSKGHAGAREDKTEISCAKAFGHLVAPGWIALNGTTSVSSHCKLPFGIGMKLGIFGRESHKATTTPATPDTKAPSIFVTSTSLGTSTAVVTWVTNERATSQVSYGSTATYGSLSATDSTLKFFHSVVLTGLTPSAAYHFQVMSKDASGNVGTSSDGTFTTNPLPDTTAPVISAVGVSTVGSTTATVSWATNEPSTSKVYFAADSSLDVNTTPAIVVSGLTTNHAVVLTGLTGSTTYRYVVRSADALGNTSTSATSSFVTSL